MHGEEVREIERNRKNSTVLPTLLLHVFMPQIKHEIGAESLFFIPKLFYDPMCLSFHCTKWLFCTSRNLSNEINLIHPMSTKVVGICANVAGKLILLY